MSIRIDGTNTAANPGITGADADTGLQFGTDEIQLVTGGTNRATVENNGNFTIEDGNLVVADGHGIDFSATSGTGISELLNDYERGTWTPTAAGGTLNSSSWGTYIKIGKRVDLFFRITVDTMDNATSPFFLAGTPFTPESTYGGYVGACMANNVSFQSGATQVVTYNHSTTGGIRLYSVQNNSDWHSLRRVELNANDSVYGTSSFYVD